MPNIIQEYRKPTTQERFGKAFANAGEAAGKALPEYMMSKNDETYFKKNYNVDTTGLSPALKQNIMAEELKRGRLLNQAKASVGEDTQAPQQFEEPEAQVGQPRKRTSSNNIAQEEYGSLHEPETAGQKQRIWTPKEEINEGIKKARESNARGIPMTKDEGIQLARQDNAHRMQYNQHVEADKQLKKAEERDYSNIAESKIVGLYPEASEEVKAIFRKEGQEAAAQNQDEASVNKQMAQKATEFTNMIGRIRKSAQPKRLFEGIFQDILGTSRKDADFRADMRIKLAPLLDQGLYDTARAELSNIGYAPEEVEGILSELGEGSKKVVAQLPNMERKTREKRMGRSGNQYNLDHAAYSPEQLNTIAQSMHQVFENDPSTNLVLLRKAYEEKGVNWETFKNMLNDQVNSGNLKLNSDQLNSLPHLDEPPLNNLYRLLENIKLVGR